MVCINLSIQCNGKRVLLFLIIAKYLVTEILNRGKILLTLLSNSFENLSFLVCTDQNGMPSHSQNGTYSIFNKINYLFILEFSARLTLSKYHWSGDGYQGCVQRRADELTPPLGPT